MTIAMLIAALNELRMFDVLTVLGIFVGAISGAIAAGRRRLDLIGVVVVSFVAATGGGSLRDMLLSQPVWWLRQPHVLIIVAVAALATFLWASRWTVPWRALLVTDAAALGAFTVIGIQAAGPDLPALSLIVLGGITAAAGGIVRDVLVNQIPLVFRRELYLTAALIGGLGYVLMLKAGWTVDTASVCAAALGCAVRLAALRWKINLPAFVLVDDQRRSSEEED